MPNFSSPSSGFVFTISAQTPAAFPTEDPGLVSYGFAPVCIRQVRNSGDEAWERTFLMRYQDYGGFRPQLIYGAVSHGVGSKLFWTALSTRRYRRLCQNGLEPQWQRAASIVWCRVKDAAALLFKKICPARPYSGGGSRTARVKIVLVKRQGGNLPRKESTRRVEIAPAVPDAFFPEGRG